MLKLETIFRASVERITEADLRFVLEHRTEILRNLDDALLQLFQPHVRAGLELIGDMVARRYDAAPWFAPACFAAALIYLLEPQDQVPDALPDLGRVDDTGVLLLALRLTKADLEVYLLWREQHRTGRILH